MRGRLCRWARPWGRVLCRGGGAPSSHADTHVGQGREVRRSETTRHRDRIDEERAIALGIQWLSTPRRWRRAVV